MNRTKYDFQFNPQPQPQPPPFQFPPLISQTIPPPNQLNLPSYQHQHQQKNDTLFPGIFGNQPQQQSSFAAPDLEKQLKQIQEQLKEFKK